VPELNLSKIKLYVTLAIVCLLYAFPTSTMDSDASGAREPVNLGLKVWAPDFFSYLAQDKGFFERNNVKVNLTLVQDYQEIIKNYTDGNFDGMIPVYSDLIYWNMLGMDSRVVYAIDFSNTGDVIIGQGNITALADEKGKRIGVEGINSFSHLFVLEALKKRGLDEGDVEIKTVPAENVTQELDKGTIAAAHIYQPYTSEALKKGYKILFTAGEIPGAITDVLIFRSKVIQERPQEIQAIIKSIIEAQQYYENNKEESLKIMSHRSGIGVQAIKNGLDSVVLPSLKDNFVNAMNNKSSEVTSLYSSGKYISQFFLNRGQFDEYPDFSQLIDPQFVNALYKDVKNER
jgi:NitT/TauT family transport system substrate-binding protein